MSWAAFGVSIVAVVCAIRVAQTRNEKIVKKLGSLLELLNQGKEPDDWVPIPTVTSSGSITILNNIGIRAFVLGIFLLSFFVGLNLRTARDQQRGDRIVYADTARLSQIHD